MITDIQLETQLEALKAITPPENAPFVSTEDFKVRFFARAHNLAEVTPRNDSTRESSWMGRIKESIEPICACIAMRPTTSRRGIHSASRIRKLSALGAGACFDNMISSSIVLGSSEGKMVVFNENDVRPMGRTASGVIGINLGENADCIGMDIAHDDDNLLIVTRNGYGKKTLISEYRKTKRGSKGVTAINVTDKNGPMMAFKNVIDGLDLLIITESGMIIRLPIEQVSQLGRVTQGVRLINLKDEQYVSTISLTIREDESEEEIEENTEENVENTQEINNEKVEAEETE